MLSKTCRAVMKSVAAASALAIAGCASGGPKDGESIGFGPMPGGASAGVVSDLETKVASLEIENRTLRQRIAELVARIADTAEADAPPEAGPAGADPRDLPSADAPQPQPTPAAPVISAPAPGIDLPREQAPVEAAPRLVQPTFASAETVFENEAGGDALSLSSVLWGVHLDSYSRESFAKEGWRRLQRSYPDELGLLEPRTETVEIEGRGEIFRLIGGGFASEGTAKELCKALTAKSQYCRVVTFTGKRLSLAAGD